MSQYERKIKMDNTEKYQEMNGTKKSFDLLITFLLLICFSLGTQAQAKKWKTKKLYNDKVTVTYRISERTNKDGDVVTLIEDDATIIDSLSLENCIAVLKDGSKHKEFTNDKISSLVKAISANEWIVYYYTDNPWPIANSDCVAKMTFTENTDEKTVIFKLTAAPTAFEEGNVNRMTYYNIIYTFKDLGNGLVEINMSGKTTPPVKVSNWLIEAAFPKAPAEALYNMVELIKNYEQ